MRNLWLAVLPVLATFPAVAHDFWMQPRVFNPPAASTVLLSMLVGHGTARERWGAANSNVVLFKTIGPDGMLDRKSNLSIGGPGFDALVPLVRAGSYMFILQSTATPSQLPFLRFNDYVTAEGVTPIIAQRQRLRQEKTDGREIYSRRAKALVQVGALTGTNHAMVTRAVGLKLEIVPERNPYALDASRMLPVRVMYKGRRLPGATVKLTSLEFDAKPLASAVTDRNGHASLRVPPVGDWLVNTIWSEPVKNDPKADFETTFSSLTFGYDPASRRR